MFKERQVHNRACLFQSVSVRIARTLAAMNVLLQTDVETYTAGPIARAFAVPALLAGFKFMCAPRVFWSVQPLESRPTICST